MPPIIKMLLKKAAVILGILVVLTALFNSVTFTGWLNAILQTAFGNIMDVLNANVGLIALAIVIYILWKVVLPTKKK